MLLADIGNTHFHIYDGERVEHLPYSEAIGRYRKQPLKYISVNTDIEKQIGCIGEWENISQKIHLPGEYDTMGVDRKALCLSHENGIFVDAGTAITVDIMEKGIYRGGFIFPGIQAMVKCYAGISPVLDIEVDPSVDPDRLPFTTKEQISYGIIASIKALINQHRNRKTLYFTGGDGEFLSTFFEHADYSETLVFEGMRYALKEMREC